MHRRRGPCWGPVQPLVDQAKELAPRVEGPRRDEHHFQVDQPLAVREPGCATRGDSAGRDEDLDQVGGVIDADGALLLSTPLREPDLLPSVLDRWGREFTLR